MKKKVTKKKVTKNKINKKQGYSRTIEIEQSEPGKAKVTIKQKILGEAPKEHRFIVKDGKVLKSVYDLIDSIPEMAEDIFTHHVNEIKNDFAVWIEDVFHDKDLADDVREIRDRTKLEYKLMKKVVKEMRQALE